MNYYVPRIYPKNLKNIKFQFKNNNHFGMINLCCLDQDLIKIKDINSLVTQRKRIFIYFPVFDHFYITEFQSENGFTLKQLIINIRIAGLAAFTYYAILNNLDPSVHRSALGEYALTWTPQQSDIQITNDQIYISVQH